MIDIGYTGAFLGGVLTLLSPCSAVLLPAFFAYAFSSPTALIGRTLAFYAGLVTTLVPLGVAASSLGALVTEYRQVLIVAMSLIVIALGALQLFGISIPLPSRTRSPQKSVQSTVSVYLLGTVYGIAGICSGPILGSVLAVAALGSDVVYGGVLLAVYALGMIVPVAVLALLWDRCRLAERRWLRPRPLYWGRIHTTSTGIVSGVLFIAIGVLLLATAGTANLGGLLSIDAQYATESVIARFSAAVPNLAIVLLIASAAAVLLLWMLLRRRSATGDRGASSDTTEPDRTKMSS